MLMLMGHNKKCEPLLPALENEQYHRLVDAGLTDPMLSEFHIFIPANAYVYLSTHVYAYCVLLPVHLNNEI